MDGVRPMRPWTFRVENIPPKTTAEGLKGYFHMEDQPYIRVRSIAPAVDCEGFDGELTATISFQSRDGTATAPHVLDDTISVDGDFHGFTPLSQPKGPIAADIIAVTGLAAHAYGAWAHSSDNMWLRDYLPKDVAKARVLIYGYPSQLQGSASNGILADHSNNFVHRLLSMRESARCQDRPIVFIGHSLGCLIIKKALSDVNGSVRGYNSTLPVCAIIFFGAPHRGLQTKALETLVKSRPTEDMIRELRARSPTLNDLNDKFRFVAKDIDILTCFELWQTNKAIEMPDGSWKREGEPEMMVLQDSAQLNLPKERMVSCYADHRQIAKLRRGESGAYPDIKRAIKQALLRVAEEQGNVGQSRLQLQPGGEAVGEEGSQYNGDCMEGSVPEPSMVQAVGSPLDDAQSQGTSIPEPPGKTADVLHDKDVLSTPNTPALDDCESEAQVQNKQAISDPTITSHSTQVMWRDDEKLPEGIEALKVSIPRATDHWDALTSPMEKESHDKGAKRPYLRPKLCSASQEGDVEKVRSLLAQGSSIHESSEKLVDCDRDAFLLAALNGRLEVLKLLIQHNCDVSKRDLKRGTALHLICYDPEIKPKPVIESLVVLLLDHGVPLEAKGINGNTALLLSAYYGKIPIAECVLDYGADVHCASNNGYTALHHAASMDHHETVALLISKGAPIEARTRERSYTALHLSCLADGISGKGARLLLEAGADKEAASGFHSRRALHLVAQQGNIEVLNELLAFGVEIDVGDSDKWRALHRAKFMGQWRIIEALLAKGANPLLKDNARRRPSDKGWCSDSNISPEDKEKCLKLLHDAEKVWEEKKRREKEEARRKRKESGGSSFSRLLGKIG